MSYASQVLADGPRGYWRMNETSGLIQDSSGNANHAVAQGGTPIYRAESPIISDSTSRSIIFNGTSNWFGVLDHNTLDLGDVFTLEAWVKTPLPTGAGEQWGIVSKDAGAYYMRVYETGQLEILRNSVADIAWTDVAVDDTRWWHCVVTKSGATVAQYVNGVDETGAVTNSTCANNTAGLTVGGSSDAAEFFRGNLTEVAVYPTALSQARVVAHYSAAFTDEPPIGFSGRGAGW